VAYIFKCYFIHFLLAIYNETMRVKVDDETAKQLREIAILKGISEEKSAEEVLSKYASKYVRDIELAQATAKRWKERFDSE